MKHKRRVVSAKENVIVRWCVSLQHTNKQTQTLQSFELTREKWLKRAKMWALLKLDIEKNNLRKVKLRKTDREMRSLAALCSREKIISLFCRRRRRPPTERTITNTTIANSHRSLLYLRMHSFEDTWLTIYLYLPAGQLSLRYMMATLSSSSCLFVHSSLSSKLGFAILLTLLSTRTTIFHIFLSHI